MHCFLNVNKSPNQKSFSTVCSYKVPLWSFKVILQTEMKVFLPFHILQLVKSPPFHKPKGWKRYPFRAEPPHFEHYRKYPPPPAHPPGALLTKPPGSEQHDVLSNCIHLPITYNSWRRGQTRAFFQTHFGYKSKFYSVFTLISFSRYSGLPLYKS